MSKRKFDFFYILWYIQYKGGVFIFNEINWIKIIIIVVIFSLLYLAYSLLSNRVLQKHNNLAIKFIINAGKFFLISVAFFSVLNEIAEFKSFMSALLTNSALMVAVLGFALQTTIKNTLSGMMIIYSEPFKVGDRIKLEKENITGTVESISLRHTTIKLITNEIAIVPNFLMNESVIVNNTYNNDFTNCYPVEFEIPIKTYSKKVEEDILEIVLSDKRLLHLDDSKKPELFISNYTKDTVTAKIFVWTENIDASYKVISDLKKEILLYLQKKVRK